jgi:hypothetical protein
MKINEKVVPADSPPDEDDDDDTSLLNERPGLVVPIEVVIMHWNHKGCPGDWKGDGTDNTTLPEELQAEDCPQSTKDAAIKWYSENSNHRNGKMKGE